MSAASSSPAVFDSQLPEQMQVYVVYRVCVLVDIIGRFRVFFSPTAPLRALDCAIFRFPVSLEQREMEPSLH